MELFSYDVNGEPKISACFSFFFHGRLLCVIREGCYILRLCQHANCNHWRSGLDLYYKWHPDSAGKNTTRERALFHFAGFILYKSTQLELDVAVHVSGTVSPTSSLSADKSKCWMERTSTTNYCQPWSRSPRRSTRPPPPPSPSSGPPVSQGWASRPRQPVRQTRQTCKTDTPKGALGVGCAAACGAERGGAAE